MKRMTPEEFLSSKECPGLGSLPENFETFNKMMQSYADHCEETAWVSIEERLPESYEDVLLYCQEFGVQMLGFVNENDRFFQIGFSQTFGITHWRPLPKPPKQ